MLNQGKVAPKQKVLIRFNAYPYKEYGTVITTVDHISPLPETKEDKAAYYEVITYLPDSIMTDYGNHLVCQPNMTAQALIITEDRSLLERIFSQFLSFVKKKHMTFIEKIRLIERVDGLIQRRATGSPKQLSEKLGISERCKYDIINLMKNMGAPINYCNASTRYYYEGEVEFQIGFGNKNSNITGGINIFSPLQDSCSSTPYFYKIFLPLNAYKWWEDRKKIFSELLGLV